jgi:ABC-type antimicrobial peptide transport system permease subunit
MALGAERTSVLVLVLREGMVLTFKGLCVGTIVAIFLSREAARLPVAGLTMAGAGNLLGASATDPIVYVGAAVLLCAIAAIANYIPARRATRIDPLVALRFE